MWNVARAPKCKDFRRGQRIGELPNHWHARGDLRRESLVNRKLALHVALVRVRDGIEINDHMEHDDAALVFSSL
jgi:hypothetical protein